MKNKNEQMKNRDSLSKMLFSKNVNISYWIQVFGKGNFMMVALWFLVRACFFLVESNDMKHVRTKWI